MGLNLPIALLCASIPIVHLWKPLNSFEGGAGRGISATFRLQRITFYPALRKSALVCETLAFFLKVHSVDLGEMPKQKPCAVVAGYSLWI